MNLHLLHVSTPQVLLLRFATVTGGCRAVSVHGCLALCFCYTRQHNVAYSGNLCKRAALHHKEHESVGLDSQAWQWLACDIQARCCFGLQVLGGTKQVLISSCPHMWPGTKSAMLRGSPWMAVLMQTTSHEGSSAGQLARIPTNCLKVSPYQSMLTSNRLEKM